jgi:hypothetical protein
MEHFGYRQVKWLLWLFCLVSPAGLVKAQTSLLKGQVTGEGGAPLAGVTVTIKGTSVTTTTDNDGRFRLDVRAAGTLQFSSVGYAKKEARFQPGSVLNIVLAQDVRSLKDVVVVGYGTQRSRDVTGAIAKISAKNIKDLPVSTVGEAMAAQVAC